MRLVHLVFAITVAAIWGINFVAAKLGMEHLPPLYICALRFFLVGLLLLPFVKIPWERLTHYAFISVTLGTLHFSLVFAGIYQGLDVTTAVLTTQMGVPFSCLLGAMFLNDKLGIWRSSGLLIAFLGVILIAGSPNVGQNYLAFLMVLGGAFCWGISNIQIKKLGDVEILPLLCVVSFCAAPQMLAVSLVLEDNHWELLKTITLTAALSVLYSSVFSTIVAYGLWYYLIRLYPISMVAPYSLLTPFFGVVSGMMVFGDALTWQTIAGGLLTIAGVAVIVIRRPRTASLGE